MSSPVLPDVPAADRSVAALRQQFRVGKQALIDQFRDARPTARSARQMLYALARLVDRTLQTIWRSSGLPETAALVAVGGYGRGDLFPHSDIDVLLLLTPESAADADVQARIGELITTCWDVGLEIGSSVRTVAECVTEARNDVTVQTAMLECRYLSGSRRLFTSFKDATSAQLDPTAFLHAKLREMRQRHLKYEDTPYALEPNIKESPGGLRDLQVVMWLARAAGLGRSWNELAHNGLMTAFESRQVQRHEGTLMLIRARLHVVAGRREERLIFDLQTAVAESFGYEGTKHQRASEQLMQRYYWAAKAVTQLNQILILNIEERVTDTVEVRMRPINERFLDRRGMLEVASDDLYRDQPHAILETFLIYQQTPGIKGLSARTLRALYNARHAMDQSFRHDPANRATFMNILRQPEGQTHAFRLMNETSVLGRYLWAFRRIVGRMQHDLFHVYTVDQHILMVLRNVRRFFIPEHAHEYPLCTRLASNWDKPWLLYIAALFHDVAKGRGGDHSELGATEVRQFATSHGLDKADSELVEFLVREHLTMSHVAQKEDMSDPAVIQRFAGRVGDVRHLTGLYLLTVADIRGTSPKVWNAWKGKLLSDLYHQTVRALGGIQPELLADAEGAKAEARQILALHAALPGTETPLWNLLEPSYFVRHDGSEMAWHARALWRHLDSALPIARARPSPIGEGLQVLVYAPDSPELFARICGYFDSAGFSILDAKIHTTKKNYALDTFQVTSDLHEDEDHPTQYRNLISLVETQMAQALVNDGPLPPPSRGRVSRRVRSFPVRPRVTLRPDERRQRWLMSVSASDRSGLLYAIARVLAQHELSLQLAKISTLGERVEDTFLISGDNLNNTREQSRLEGDVLAVLTPS